MGVRPGVELGSLGRVVVGKGKLGPVLGHDILDRDVRETSEHAARAVHGSSSKGRREEVAREQVSTVVAEVLYGALDRLHVLAHESGHKTQVRCCHVNCSGFGEIAGYVNGTGGEAREEQGGTEGDVGQVHEGHVRGDLRRGDDRECVRPSALLCGCEAVEGSETGSPRAVGEQREDLVVEEERAFA